MKKNCLLFLSLFALVMLFNACSTDVDLYAGYKDITVIYGLLDSDKDTNYVKINRAFLGPGNALEIAMIADSCNYPSKLDAKIVEYRATPGGNNFQKSGRELVLDTMTIHNKNTEGFFYAPNQLVYYTTEPVYTNSERYKYKYELLVDRGDTILSAETDMTGGYGFNINTAGMSFSGESGTPIKWNPCPNAAIYEVVLKFNYLEMHGFDSVPQSIEWSLGTYPETSLELDHNMYVVSHKSEAFYNKLAEKLQGDTIGVTRLVADYPICISIAAGNEELYNFISVNAPSSSIVQSIPEYTNIKGGYGVFASRTLQEKWVRFNSITDISKWGFRQMK
jgi:hypothetical protein